MNGIFVTLVVLIVIASVLLTIVILLQSGKGEGLASNFVAANQAFGVRQTADGLEKLTWGLVAFILVCSVASNFAKNSARSSEFDKAAAKVASTPLQEGGMGAATENTLTLDADAESTEAGQNE